MPSETDHYGDQRAETPPRRRPPPPRPVGTFLAAGETPSQAAALAADLAALIDAGLIRRERVDGGICFELTELGRSTNTEEE